jgi:hypothetical protein
MVVWRLVASTVDVAGAAIGGCVIFGRSYHGDSINTFTQPAALAVISRPFWRDMITISMPADAHCSHQIYCFSLWFLVEISHHEGAWFMISL